MTDRPRVVLLATPLSARAHLDGTTRAVIDLARGLVDDARFTPVVLVRSGIPAPNGCEAIVVGEGAGPLAIFAAVSRARVDVVHAMFAPRRRTGVALRMLRRPIVQTLASLGRLDRLALGGDVIVATSRAMQGRVDGSVYVPMPFAPESVASIVDPPKNHALFVGDYEHGDALEPAIAAIEQASSPNGVVPTLAIAARAKSTRARSIEAALRARIARSRALRARVTIVSEVPSLLPYLAGARCVLLPATSTEAKLDHPRVLLEAIAIGTRILVGNAPSLRELVTTPAIGEVVADVASLRDAIERAFEPHPIDRAAVTAILSPRAPHVVARAYAELYDRVTTSRAR